MRNTLPRQLCSWVFAAASSITLLSAERLTFLPASSSLPRMRMLESRPPPVAVMVTLPPACTREPADVSLLCVRVDSLELLPMVSACAHADRTGAVRILGRCLLCNVLVRRIAAHPDAGDAQCAHAVILGIAYGVGGFLNVAQQGRSTAPRSPA